MLSSDKVHIRRKSWIGKEYKQKQTTKKKRRQTTKQKKIQLLTIMKVFRRVVDSGDLTMVFVAKGHCKEFTSI